MIIELPLLVAQTALVAVLSPPECRHVHYSFPPTLNLTIQNLLVKL